MRRMLVLSEKAVRENAVVSKVIENNRTAFQLLERGKANVPERIIMGVAGVEGKTLVKPCDVEETPAFGLKIIHVRPGNAVNRQPTTPATIMLYDKNTGEPKCLLSGTFLTALRTAAGSAVATDLLSAPQSSRLVVFGAGLQGEAHIKTICAVREIKLITIVNRSKERAMLLVDSLKKACATDSFRNPKPTFCSLQQDEMDLVRKAVSEADIICTTTGSATPLFPANWVKDHVHINAVGSYQPNTSELDPELFRRLGKLVVDTDDAWQAGDLGVPLEMGYVEKSFANRLGQLCFDEGNINRHDSRKPTIFKSVGTAIQDVYTAYQIMEDCMNKGTVGTWVEL